MVCRVEEINKLLNVCFERLNSWKESIWIIYQISCCQVCTLLDENTIKRLFDYIQTDEDIIDMKCIVPILRTFSNIIATSTNGSSANEFIIGLRKHGYIFKNILIKNRHINLNDECAWLLGNVFNMLQITDVSKINCLVSSGNFDEICNYLFI